MTSRRQILKRAVAAIVGVPIVAKAKPIIIPITWKLSTGWPSTGFVNVSNGGAGTIYCRYRLNADKTKCIATPA